MDLDPQANLSQYFLGAQKYLELIKPGSKTVVDIFEQFSAPSSIGAAPTLVKPSEVIHKLHKWNDGSLLDLAPSRLELAWTLKNQLKRLSCCHGSCQKSKITMT